MNTFQPTMVATRIMPSVTERYSPDMAFCAASAMITSSRTSPMPTAPTSAPDHDAEQQEQEPVHHGCRGGPFPRAKR